MPNEAVIAETPQPRTLLNHSFPATPGETGYKKATDCLPRKRPVVPVKLVQMVHGSAWIYIAIRPESNLKCVYRANDSVCQVGSLPIVHNYTAAVAFHVLMIVTLRRSAGYSCSYMEKRQRSESDYSLRDDTYAGVCTIQYIKIETCSSPIENERSNICQGY